MSCRPARISTVKAGLEKDRPGFNATDREVSIAVDGMRDQDIDYVTIGVLELRRHP